MGKRKDNRWNDIDGGAAFLIPLTLLRHPNYARLSPWAVKLIMDLARQYSGFNNGYLCASRSLMKKCGWGSTDTLQKAVEELEHYRIIVRTQQGGRNRPTLHGLTWRRIDHKPGAAPLDVPQTIKPDNQWKEARPPFVRTSGTRKSARHGPSAQHEIGLPCPPHGPTLPAPGTSHAKCCPPHGQQDPRLARPTV